MDNAHSYDVLERFPIKDLMAPIYARSGLYLTPIIVTTSPGHEGGVVSYAKVRPQIERLCKQDCDAYVTTMFDLYALPRDFPGKSSSNDPATQSGRQKAAFLEGELPASSALTQKGLNWKPTGPSLISDLDKAQF